MTEEKAVAFLSHLTGHGIDTIKDVLEKSEVNGVFRCILGGQLYSVNGAENGRYIRLTHSFIPEPSEIKWFNAKTFRPALTKNEKAWQIIKDTILQGCKEQKGVKS